MFKNRFQRTTALVAASSLSLGLTVASVAGSAGAAVAHVTPGVTSTSITIGATVPLTGIASGYAEVSAAANAVFKYVNAKGGINGRKITYIRKDDCYGLTTLGGCTAGASTTTLSQTQSLVSGSHVFATVGSLGTATQDSVRNYLKTNGTPQLFVNSGSSDWNLPTTSTGKKYPMLFGFQASYNAEGKVFATYIKTKLPATINGTAKKVGFIGQNDDFGANGYVGLTGGPAKTVVAPSDKFLYNPANALFDVGDIGPHVATLQSDKVNVVVLDSIPPVTSLILQKAKALGYSPKWIISSVGSNPVAVNNTLENGAVSFDSLPATNDVANPWNVWLKKVLLADKTDFPSFTSASGINGNQQYGASFAVAFLEVLNAFGHSSFTQAQFVSKLTASSTVLSTPSIVPLKYSALNHQGLQCGVMSSIVATASSKNITTPSHVVSCTLDSPTAPITVGKYAVTAVPAYLK